jgi:hypothetical protein
MKYNKILKPKKFDHFTIIPSYIFRHKDISVGATGLYAYLFSHTAEQEITIQFICNHFKEGKDAIASKLKELIDAGYIERERVTDKGKFKGYNYILKANRSRKNRDRKKPKSENPPQSNINIYNDNNIESNNMHSNLVLKVYPHFVNLFPKKYQPQTQSQKNKWISCLDKLERIEKLDFHKLWLVVKFIREHEFWGVHFLSLLKLRNKDKNGIMYVHKYIETYDNANKPKFWWRVKGLIKYFIYQENGKTLLGADTKKGKLNEFNISQTLNKYQINQIKKIISSDNR